MGVNSYFRAYIIWIAVFLILVLILIRRNILGEDLGPVSMKELDQIENQIDASLKHIRSKKVENFDISCHRG